MNTRLILLVLFLLLSVTPARTQTYHDPSGQYYKILRVIDGDTVLVEAPYLPIGLGNTLYLRITGIDAPEKGMRAKCFIERRKAEIATQVLTIWLRAAKDIRIWYHGFDKYGRILGDLMIDGRYYSDRLIEQGLAVRYDGRGERKNWCE